MTRAALSLVAVLMTAAPLAPGTGEDPEVVILMELGEIRLIVFPSQAPITVANFLCYVDAGLYDGSTFHRTVRLDNQPNDAVRIEVIQGGMLEAAKCFPAIEHEPTSVTGLRHEHGAVSMARSAPGSATSSFFICVGDQPELDYGGRRNPDGQGFAAFGKVVSGMEVVEMIHRSPARGQQLEPPVRIISVRRAAIKKEAKR
jgi:peptidyl-prolyl cis-trans isomerase A (cyclophilin A)